MPLVSTRDLAARLSYNLLLFSSTVDLAWSLAHLQQLWHYDGKGLPPVCTDAAAAAVLQAEGSQLRRQSLCVRRLVPL
jgi:hypothetical protein